MGLILVCVLFSSGMIVILLCKIVIERWCPSSLTSFDSFIHPFQFSSDWEYPAYEDHSGTPADTVNYTYFLQAIRDALDKLGQAKGRYFPLTAALPCGPDKIEKIQVDKIKDILDELN